MNNNRIRREILELLYKQKRRCNGGVREEFLIKNLDEKIDINDLRFHVDYLDKKGYIIIKPVYDGFITIEKFTITSKGIDLVENLDALNSEFPLKK